jgi:hypothetical protein
LKQHVDELSRTRGACGVESPSQQTCDIGKNEVKKSEDRLQIDAAKNETINKETEDGTWLDRAGWISVLKSTDGSGIRIVEWL